MRPVTPGRRGRVAEVIVIQTVGFIGLGTMGLPMVGNLSKAGFTVVAHDASDTAMQAVGRLVGVRAVPTPRAVTEEVEVLFTCLPTDDTVKAVYLGANGIAAGGRPGLITCDCSTVSPEATLEVHRGVALRGISHMDTPMLGSQPQAVSGEIFFIVGGEKDQVARIEPYLRAMGKLHIHVGPVSTANRVKLMHNGLAAVVSVAVAEALATCVNAGVDPYVFYDVVCKGGGMAYGTYWERRAKRILDGDFTPTFMLQHMRKDATLALDHARRVGTPTPLLEETRKSYEEAMEAGWGGEDFSAVTHVVERRIGRPLSRHR
jgi:3-hydroxyisobutyrate dehydrogenase-like beta-hydroxyacid dehydrogenase